MPQEFRNDPHNQMTVGPTGGLNERIKTWAWEAHVYYLNQSCLVIEKYTIIIIIISIIIIIIILISSRVCKLKSCSRTKELKSRLYQQCMMDPSSPMHRKYVPLTRRRTYLDGHEDPNENTKSACLCVCLLCKLKFITH